MGRSRGQRAYRKSLKTTEKYHNEIVDRLYENPGLLDELGLDSARIIWREKEPKPLVEGGRRVDLLFLYDFGDFYEIALFEEVIGTRHPQDHPDQLRHAYLDFKYHWKEWFRERKGKINFSNKEVLISTLSLNWDPLLSSLKNSVDIRHSKRRVKLGKLILAKL